ncbi:hypothetical protein IU500_33385 [Nocardia terpenica]|uniref:DNA-3-methyladenine glycosylase family protein n=1 Tax=Nocardia terpenica TaxID=455432 RepID=UPI0018957151|nr:hypothetical protein [Nocardia terpenica]MBF6065342.1 hypothetical protein [Nocardia terpenica]MBF6108914.1 hypothetical protein [Nocardia terpenica]MBF6121757.1 hypothetical protein [Nocardia terpenica]
MGRHPVTLTEQANLTVCPPAPFHFDTTTSKPSTLPDPTTVHEPGVHWQTVRWGGQVLGIRLSDNGTREDPKLGVTVFAERALPPAVVESIGFELRWRYDLDTDLSWFCRRFAADPALSGPIERIGGMRVSCAFSLYEWVSVLALLQMATAGRISAMVGSVFDAYGRVVQFDGRRLHAFWEPHAIATAGEAPLRAMKLGYRAKSLVRIANSVLDGDFDENAIRVMDRDRARAALLKLYGIGPASVGYLMFQTFHHYDAFDVVPPWETKLYSRLLYDTESVPAEDILTDMTARYGRWRALAGAYLLEDLFLRHQHDPIDWLAAEIRM